MNIEFVALNESHFPLMLKWLKTPHVKAFWDPEIDWTLELVKEKYGDYVMGYKLEEDQRKKIDAYIIVVEEEPVGYVQIYNAYDFEREQPLVGLPEKLAAFDIFIGEKDYLKRGIASKTIYGLLKLYSDMYTHAFVDPEEDNLPAIRTYQKLGFVPLENQGNPGVLRMLYDNN